MKVALIVPENAIVSSDKMDDYNWENMWEFQARKRLWSTPSLSLLTIAGMFTEEFSLSYFDLNFPDEDLSGYDMAVFSPSTSQTKQAYALADSLRIQNTIVIMGGVHVTMMPEEALKHSDVIFIGEAEETFSLFLKDFANKKLSRIYKSSQYPDLKTSPVPRYDLAEKYPYKSIPIQTSRGCPHQCEFCVSSKLYGKRFRRKPISLVKNELEQIKRIWKRPFIFFTDDNMFIDSKYNLELINCLSDLQLKWYAFSDARIADQPDLLKQLTKSGCTQLLIGFESLSEENLAQINRSHWKKKKLTDYFRVVETIQSFGIGVVGSFVFGLDADTSNVFMEVWEFIRQSHLYATNLTVITPFPGSNLYLKFNEQARITVTDWSRYNGFELTFEPRGFTIPEFEEGFCWLQRQLDSKERINDVINHFKEIYKKRDIRSIGSIR